MIGLKALFNRRAASALILGLMLSLTASSNLAAQGTDPATQRVSSLSDALLDTMKQAKELGVKGRYDKLSPVLAKTYDLPLMTRIAVGPNWATLTPEQQKAVVAAFTRMTTATYASRFDGFSGEQFVILQTVDQKNGDKIVKTQIIQSNGKPVALSYLVRNTGSDWRIIDVYLNGTISEVASRRAEFAGILKSGGLDALLKALHDRSNKLLAG